MPRWKPGEIVIEFIRVKGNSEVQFKSLMMRVRGAWSPENMTAKTALKTGFHTIPPIPGQYIALDVNAKTVRVIDPLGFRENAPLLAEIFAKTETWLGPMRPHDTSVLKPMSVDLVKTVLFEMWEWVEAGKARVINGTMPSKQEILERKANLRRRFFYCVEGQTPYATFEEMELLAAKDEPVMQTTPAIQ